MADAVSGYGPPPGSYTPSGALDPYADPFTTPLTSRSLLRVAGGLDSLTDGAGTIYSTYRTEFLRRLKSLYGDGGLGMIPHSFAGFAGLNLQSGLFNPNTSGIGDLAASNPIRARAPAGQGTYTSSATNATLAFDDYGGTFADCDTVSVWMELRTSGGTCSFQQTNGGVQGVALSSANVPVGTPFLFTRKLDTTQQRGCTFYNITGDWSFYTMEFTNSAAKKRGVTFSNFGVGGQSAAAWASLDDTWQRFWWKTFGFDVFILNQGMNDRGSSDDFQFARSVMTNVSRLQECPKTRVLMVIPHEATDIATSYQGKYPQVLDAIAKARGCGLIDDRVAMGGTYAQSVTKGLMDVPDGGIHPTPAGNAARALSYIEALRLR